MSRNNSLTESLLKSGPPKHRVRIQYQSEHDKTKDKYPDIVGPVYPQSEYERKIQASRDAEAFDASQRAATGRDRDRASASLISDPCDRILDGVRFQSIAARDSAAQRIRDHVNQEVAIARINAEVHGENVAAKLKATIQKLRTELHRSHQRHVQDVIEAHGATFPNDGAIGIFDSGLPQ